MGRHKKNCMCPKCTSKATPIRSEQILNGIKNTKARVEESDEPEVYTTSQEPPVVVPEVVDIPRSEEENVSPPPSDATSGSSDSTSTESTEVKFETIRPLVESVIPPLMNIIFERMQVPTLSELESDTLVNTTSIVLSKYSRIYEFSYKEEFVMASCYAAVLLPRIKTYRKRKYDHHNTGKDGDGENNPSQKNNFQI